MNPPTPYQVALFDIYDAIGRWLEEKKAREQAKETPRNAGLADQTLPRALVVYEPLALPQFTTKEAA